MSAAVIEASLGELARRVGAGELACRDVMRAFVDRIGAVDGRVGAFLECRAEAALAEAAAADEARARGAALSPLHGLPLAAKDILASPDFDTTCGSRILAGFRSPYRATVLERLARAGLVVLGRLNMDEFAMGSSCESSAFQVTRNPWDLERVPGGSSGGSAAAVASREVPVALGTDTGGSIRQPAALCGVAGMKPTYGRVSRYGLVAFASSLDQIGPLANDVADLATLLGVVAGHDPKDATSLAMPVPDYAAELTGCVEGLRVGLVREMFEGEGADPDSLGRVREAVRELERRGAKTVEVSLPHTSYGVAAYYLLATAEASSNLARYDGVKFGYRAPAEDLDTLYRRTRSQGFGREVKRRILLGTYVLSAGYYDAYYRKAQRVRTLIRRDFDRALAGCDVLVAPTTPGPAWKIGERVEDPIQMYLADVFTVTVSLAGLPALSVPCGFTRAGLPVGWQIIGRPLDEGTVLRVGDAYQRETDWHRTLPRL